MARTGVGSQRLVVRGTVSEVLLEICVTKLVQVIALSLLATPAFSQDFVTECTLDHTAGEEILCQTNGVWGTCFEAGPNSCDGENPDAPGECRGYPDCGIAFCETGALRGDSCVVAGEPGGCIPICEVDFDLSCDAGGMEMVCEISSSGMFDEGDDINCATGGGAAGPSLLLIAVVAGFRRRRRQ